jgi:hypothetical protein
MYNDNDEFEIITNGRIKYVTKLSHSIEDNNIFRRIIFRLICLKYEVIWMTYRKGIRLALNKNGASNLPPVIYLPAPDKGGVNNLSQDVIPSVRNEDKDYDMSLKLTSESSKDGVDNLSHEVVSPSSDDVPLSCKKELSKNAYPTISNLRKYDFFAKELKVLNNNFNYFIGGYGASLSDLKEVVRSLMDNGLYDKIPDSVVLKSFLNIFELFKPNNFEAFLNAFEYKDNMVLKWAIKDPESTRKLFNLPTYFYAILRKESNYELIKKLILKSNYLKFKAIQNLVLLGGEFLENLTGDLKKRWKSFGKLCPK